MTLFKTPALRTIPLICSLLFYCLSVSSFGFVLKAKQALLIDLSTETVLYEKEADTPSAPSSMSKIMTAYLVFERLQYDALTDETLFVVSQKAYTKKGSTMFLRMNDRVSVDALLKGMLVQSGNDAAITLAEGIAGSEEAFAELSTDKAKELGALKTNFLNATGWPDKGHLTTPHDLAKIAQATLKQFPTLYEKYYALKTFTYNNIEQPNRNPLLYVPELACDGMKTGSSEAGGFGLVATTMKNGRRLLLVINGCKNQAERASDAVALMRHGLTHFASPLLIKAHDPIEYAPVWTGKKENLAIGTMENVRITRPRVDFRKMKITLHFKSPLPAPLTKGDVVGEVKISFDDDRPPQTIPLIALESVEQSHFLHALKQGVSYLFFGSTQRKTEVHSKNWTTP